MSRYNLYFTDVKNLDNTSFTHVDFGNSLCHLLDHIIVGIKNVIVKDLKIL